MMKSSTIPFTSSLQSAAKLIFVAVLLYTSPLLHAADPFTPAQNKPQPPSFASVAALLAGTRSGEIPEALTSKDFPTSNRYDKGVGQSVLVILQSQNVLPKSAVRHYTAGDLGLMFQNLTKVELSNRTDENATRAFQGTLKQFLDLHGGDKNPALRTALDTLLKQYSQAVREYAIAAKERENQALAQQAEMQRQSDLTVEKVKQDAAERKAVADAQAASRAKEDEVRRTAAQGAMQARAELKKQKLAEITASTPYQLWEVSLQVEQGVQMIETGKNQLAMQEKIEKESGVADLTARRAAGEQIAAGKLLVEKAFANYRALGGKALTPNDVKAGPDPAADYR
jgi:hypothetical protein